ncbi:putative salt-induced outer membrane protein [Sphingomonas laterariae]|uniref:Putative salt-induced outer membrane protein n=1 Tax=Edaphosphingomonas laterariae TaxID=861865 RepID=A0A239DWA7_9SPHN|nr:DUF481 domain-containing protein [Sphingomonas laterariae]SNS35884.1 putative salt-induced outer membrane protein [Sphingomonas laterariae]
MISLVAFALLAADGEPPLVAPEPPALDAIEFELAPIVYAAPPPPRPLPMPRIEVEAPSGLPPHVRSMLDAAIASGDAQAVATVTKLAKQTAPWAARDAEKLRDGFNNRIAEQKALAERQRHDRIKAASFFDGWSGELEFGASRATGNTRTLGLYGAAKGEREGLRVRHRFNGRADVQETNNETTTERWLLAYQPNFKFDDRLYAYGLGQYEHDRFLGYDSRYTLGGGFGYTVFTGPRLKLDIEGGPALRYTDFVDESDETTVAGRASIALKWAISPTASLNQDAAVYVESGNTNASSTIALDAKLFGPLRTRISYNIRYERDAPVDRDPVDTLSRATLVYTF